MDRQIFKDSTLDHLFKQEGYIVVDILTTDEAISLRERVAKLRAGVNAPFYASLWSGDRNYRQSVDKMVKEALESRALAYLNAYQSLFADLLVKRPSLRHHISAHQDWTFVDEARVASVYLWCPLQDVHRRNGTLQVFPRTHRMMDKVRGANIFLEYTKYANRISKSFGEHLTLKAGQAVFFNQALMHASKPNRTLRNRITAGLLLLPSEAEVWHFFRDPMTGHCYKVSADYEFFMQYSEGIDFRKGLFSQTIRIPGNRSPIPVPMEPIPFSFSEFSVRYRAELARKV